MKAIEVYNEYRVGSGVLDPTSPSYREIEATILRALHLLAVVEHEASQEELGAVAEGADEAFELLYAEELADA